MRGGNDKYLEKVMEVIEEACARCKSVREVKDASLEVKVKCQKACGKRGVARVGGGLGGR